MSWLYLAIELAIIGTLGFLTIYFHVMASIEVTWASEFPDRAGRGSLAPGQPAPPGALLPSRLTRIP